MREVIEGEGIAVLQGMEAESVNLVVTSPPYFALRRYGAEATYPDGWHGEMGLEPSVELYLTHLWSVFDEVWRVVRKDGVCMIDLGDSYNSHSANSHNVGGFEGAAMRANPAYAACRIIGKKGLHYPDKSLLAVPEMFMLGMTRPYLRPALSRGLAPEVEHTWIRRNTVVWHKKNPMPCSAKDKFTNSWEPVFFFVKQRRYWSDLDAVRRPITTESAARYNRSSSPENQKEPYQQNNPVGHQTLKFKDRHDRRQDVYLGGATHLSMARDAARAERRSKTADEGLFKAGGMRQAPEPGEEGAFHPLGANPGDFYIGNKDDLLTVEDRAHVEEARARGIRVDIVTTTGTGNIPTATSGRAKELAAKGYCLYFNNPLGANPRDYYEGGEDWFEISTQGRSDAHFATFPNKLVERLILFGCPEWVCKKCGKGRERVTNRQWQHQEQGMSMAAQDVEGNPMFRGGHHNDGLPYRGTAETLGWTDCGCGAGWRPGVVLDPFAGRGTVGCVAKRLGRDYVLIELQAEYAEMCRRNLEAEPEPLKEE